MAATAAQVAARRALRHRVESTRSDLGRTSRLVEELTRAIAAADLPLVRFRAALHQLYGAHASAAEHGFRSLVLERGIEHALAVVREDPRALLPGARTRLVGGEAPRALVREQATLCASVVEPLDRTLAAACDHAGIARPRDHADSVTHRRGVLDHLQRLAQGQRALLDEALDDYRHVAGTLATPHQLRREWAALDATQRAAVRAVVPDVERLKEPRAPGLRGGGHEPFEL